MAYQTHQQRQLRERGFGEAEAKRMVEIEVENLIGNPAMLQRRLDDFRLTLPPPDAPPPQAPANRCILWRLLNVSQLIWAAV